MTITLRGRLNSSNVQKVVWTLRELELPFEHVPLGGSFGGTDSGEYRAMNPNGLVPTLQDGDLTIWESHAIVRYLAAEYGSGLLYPVEPRHRAVVDQWTDWTATTFQPAWISLFWSLVRTPVERHNPAAIAKALADTSRCFEMLDLQLARAPFLAGDDLTYADIVTGVALYRWTTMEVARPDLPHVERWHARLSERSAFVEAVNVSYADLYGQLPA